MQNTLWMLLGAALVAIGVLASALADRIRGLRVSRPAHAARTTIPVIEAADLHHPAPPRQPRVPRTEPKPAGSTECGDDVIAVLVSSGYKKPAATEATWACTTAERASIEVWTAAALRRCARGGIA